LTSRSRKRLTVCWSVKVGSSWPYRKTMQYRA
jgi:hypothetical protein